MSSTPRFTLFAVLAAAAIACGPRLPDGPNGGENEVSMSLSGQAIDFDSVRLEANGDAQQITITAAGSIDPLPNAVDDESTLLLQLVLDRSRLESLTMPTTVTIDGTTSFQGGPDQDSSLDTSARLHGETESPVIENVFFRRVAFTAGSAPGSQKVSGTLTLRIVGESSIAGLVDLIIEGEIPNANDQRAAIHVLFDLDVR